MKIVTERLKLEPCTPETYMKYYRVYDMGPHINMYLAELKEDPQLMGWGIWFVIRRSDGKMIGDAGFKGKPDGEQIVEVGYGILPEAQKQGYATEAVRALIGWAVSGGRIGAVRAECYADNFASIRVLEKLGMKRKEFEGDIICWEMDIIEPNLQS